MSFEFDLSEEDRSRAEIIGHIGRDLQKMFVHRKAENGLTQQRLADELGLDKSRINRCLAGHANLTISTIADLSRAMKGKVIFKIVPEEQASQWVLSWSNPAARATSANTATTSSKTASPIQTATVPKYAKAGAVHW